MTRKSVRRRLADAVRSFQENEFPWRRIGLVLGLAAVLLWFICVGREQGPTVIPDEPLPAELNAREKLLVEAWLTDDLHNMLRLAGSTHDRALRRWLSKNPIPEAAKTPMTDRMVTIDVASVSQPNPKSADVVARVSFLADASGKGELTVKHRWTADKTGTWYFLPYVPPARRMHYK